MTSGRPARFTAPRFKGGGKATGWEVSHADWRWMGEPLLPGAISVRWADEAGAWLVGEIEGAATGPDAPFGPVPPEWVDTR